MNAVILVFVLDCFFSFGLLPIVLYNSLNTFRVLCITGNIFVMLFFVAVWELSENRVLSCGV